MIGFYFMQLFFVPLISAVYLFVHSKALSGFLLMFWGIVIYGGLGGPYSDTVKVIPFLSLAAYLLWYYRKVELLEHKAIISVVILTDVLWVLRLTEVPIPFEANLISPIILLFVPLLMGLQAFRMSQPTPKHHKPLLFMLCVLMFADLVVYIIEMREWLITPEWLSNTVLGLTLMSAGLLNYMVLGANQLQRTKEVILSYLVFTLFLRFSHWVVSSMDGVT